MYLKLHHKYLVDVFHILECDVTYLSLQHSHHHHLTCISLLLKQPFVSMQVPQLLTVEQTVQPPPAPLISTLDSAVECTSIQSVYNGNMDIYLQCKGEGQRVFVAHRYIRRQI